MGSCERLKDLRFWLEALVGLELGLAAVGRRPGVVGGLPYGLGCLPPKKTYFYLLIFNFILKAFAKQF